MAAIERTAYPRFQPIPHVRELTEYFTPTAEEMAFGHTLVQRHAALFPVILLLKCVQYLGYFPALSAIPSAIVNHVRVCLRLPAHLEPLTPPRRGPCGGMSGLSGPTSDCNQDTATPHVA